MGSHLSSRLGRSIGEETSRRTCEPRLRNEWGETTNRTKQNRKGHSGRWRLLAW